MQVRPAANPVSQSTLSGEATTRWTAAGNLSFADGKFTFSLAQIPAEDTLVLAARPVTITKGVPMPPKGGLKAIELSAEVAKGRPPAC